MPELAEAAKANNQSESLPNPIAKDYPSQVTGTLNASYFIVPITYAQARAAVPAKYPILTDLIKKMWKDYREDKYPVLAFRFPFIDVLNDGHTPYTYLPTNLLDTPLGAAAGTLYGIDAIFSNFTPSKNPYAYRPGANHKGPRIVSAKPTSQGTGKGFLAVFTDIGKLSKKRFDFWKNVLNQPFFGNPVPPSPVTCGFQYKFYDTVITKGKYAPVRVKGHISLEGGIVNDFLHGFDVKESEGTRFDVAFLEKNYLNCQDLA
ncbi:MAG: hypothetical protein Q9167_007195 [Letrouitia subvulpina]